jgi:tetratricopeptide (TPR) repeat protein
MDRLALSLSPTVKSSSSRNHLTLSLWGALALALLSPAVAVEPNIAAAMARGDAADEQLKTAESLAAYLEAEKLGDKSSEVLRKISREYSLSMVDTKSRDEQRSLGEKALEYAKRAEAAEPANALNQLGLAICFGRVAPYLDNKTKIAYSKQVKEHVDKAIKLDPSLDYAYHVLGAWNYELASFNPVLRALAKLIYGEIPAASYEDAVKDFKKAIELAPQRLVHHIELGRTYAALGQKDLARAELNKGLALPNKEKDDPGAKERGREALKKL